MDKSKWPDSYRGDSKIKVPIIAILGLPRHGKSEVAKIINEFTPRAKGALLPFELAVRSEAQKLGWDSSKGREFTASLKSMCEDMNPMHWIYMWHRSLSKLLSTNIDYVVCDDVSTPQELKTLEELGAYIILVKKPVSLWDQIQIRKNADMKEMLASLNVCDLTIENRWGLQHLQKEVEKIVEACNIRDLTALDSRIKEASNDLN